MNNIIFLLNENIVPIIILSIKIIHLVFMYLINYYNLNSNVNEPIGLQYIFTKKKIRLPDKKNNVDILLFKIFSMTSFFMLIDNTLYCNEIINFNIEKFIINSKFIENNYKNNNLIYTNNKNNIHNILYIYLYLSSYISTAIFIYSCFNVRFFILFIKYTFYIVVNYNIFFKSISLCANGNSIALLNQSTSKELAIINKQRVYIPTCADLVKYNLNLKKYSLIFAKNKTIFNFFRNNTVMHKNLMELWLNQSIICNRQLNNLVNNYVFFKFPTIKKHYFNVSTSWSFLLSEYYLGISKEGLNYEKKLQSLIRNDIITIKPQLMKDYIRLFSNFEMFWEDKTADTIANLKMVNSKHAIASKLITLFSKFNPQVSITSNTFVPEIDLLARVYLPKFNKIKWYSFQLKIKFKMEKAYEIERFFLDLFDNQKYKKNVHKFVIDISIFPLLTRNLIKKVWYSLPFYVKNKIWLIETNYCLNQTDLKKKIFIPLLNNKLEYNLLNLEKSKNFKLKDVNQNINREININSRLSENNIIRKELCNINTTNIKIDKYLINWRSNGLDELMQKAVKEI
jgi:hypothetical protein